MSLFYCFGQLFFAFVQELFSFEFIIPVADYFTANLTVDYIKGHLTYKNQLQQLPQVPQQDLYCTDLQ